MASHCESSPGSFDENKPGGHQPQTKPTNLDCQFAEKKAATIAIYYYSAGN